MMDGNYFSVCISQVIVLYTLNLYIETYVNYLNKAERKKKLGKP